MPKRPDNGERPNAETIARGLKGIWHGKTYALCACPAHPDANPSLSVRRLQGGFVGLKCFAGCTFVQIVDELKRRGLWPISGHDEPPAKVSRHPSVTVGGVSVAETMQGRQRAQEIWDQCRPAAGTLVEEYLRARGARGQVSDQLRFHPSLFHRETGKKFPAMVARGSDNKGFCFIQRTYLDGPKKADIPFCKKTLGRMGAAAVRLRAPRDRLGLAEGCETALGASRLYAVPVWATLSANRLALVEIPQGVAQIVIFGDEGEVGHREAMAAARVYEDRGLDVEVIFPHADFKKSGVKADFADIARSGA